MHAAEGAWGEVALSVFFQDLFGDAAALGGAGVGGADHFGGKGGLGVEGDVYFSAHAGGDAGIWERVVGPGGVFGAGVEFCLHDGFVDGFAGGHEAVTEMGVLIEFEGAAAEIEGVFVIAWC